MNKSIFIFACIFALTFAYDQEKEVLVLTSKDYNQAISEHNYLLVQFYAPWCGHSKKLAPEFERAAQSLKEAGSRVRLAKVDATTEEALAKKMGVEGFPTLFFYENGVKYDFDGQRTHYKILDWVRKRTESPSTYIESPQPIEDALAERELAFVFWGDEFDPVYNLYKDVVKHYMDLDFFNTDSDSVRAHFDVPKHVKISLFRKFEEKRVDYEDEYTEEAILAFLKSKTIPTLIQLNQRYMKMIFGDRKDALILVHSIGEINERAVVAMREAAEVLKDKILVAYVNNSIEIGQKVATYYHVVKDEIPMVGIIHFDEKVPEKYILRDKRITKESILEFYNDFQARKLKKEPKSAEHPDRNDDFLKVAVGITFKDLVYDDTKDVLLFVYGPNCEACRELLDNWVKPLAKKVYPVPDMRIIKLDASQNEMPIIVEKIPAFIYFPKKNKEHPHRYTGPLIVEEVKKWFRNVATTLPKDQEL